MSTEHSECLHTKQTGLRNPFLMTCVIMEGKWRRGHVATAAEQSSHSTTFAPLRSHWHCDIILVRRVQSRG